jgi:hypothetical protein
MWKNVEDRNLTSLVLLHQPEDLNLEGLEWACTIGDASIEAVRTGHDCR